MQIFFINDNIEISRANKIFELPKSTLDDYSGHRVPRCDYTTILYVLFSNYVNKILIC